MKEGIILLISIYCSLFFLILMLFLLLFTCWQNFMGLFIILLLVAFFISLFTFIMKFKIIYCGYRQVKGWNSFFISLYLILFYGSFLTFVQVTLKEFNLLTDLNDNIARLIIILLIDLEFVRLFTGGKMNYFKSIILSFGLFLLSQKEFVNYLTGAAGILLISNLMFSNEFISYLKKSNLTKEEKEKIETVLVEKKDDWKFNTSILFISYSAISALKNTFPGVWKSNIIQFLRESLFVKLESEDILRWFIDSVLISGLIVSSVALLYVVLMSTLKGNIFKKITFKFIEKEYNSIISR